MYTLRSIGLLTILGTLLVGCVPMPTCPQGTVPLNATPESKQDGTITAKVATPDGGISVDVVDERKLPIKASIDATATVSRSLKAACLNEQLFQAILTSPGRWSFQVFKDGSYELSAK
jgi:hypothetical protein